mgnify:CR=1 FL=1
MTRTFDEVKYELREVSFRDGEKEQSTRVVLASKVEVGDELLGVAEGIASDNTRASMEQWRVL